MVESGMDSLFLLRYLEKHLPVIPLGPKGTPLYDETQRVYTTLDEIRRWRREHPGANLGLPLGAYSGYVAIVLDSLKGQLTLSLWANGDLPKTWEYTDGETYVYIYKSPGGITIREQVLLGEHVKLQGEHTFVPIPPFKDYVETRNPAISGLETIAVMPRWLVGIMETPLYRQRAVVALPANFLRFVRENFSIRSDYTCKLAEIYPPYTQYCAERGDIPTARFMFERGLRDLGLAIGRAKTYKGFRPRFGSFAHTFIRERRSASKPVFTVWDDRANVPPVRLVHPVPLSEYSEDS